ncbi:uroporphyrinogen-III synthase [Photobacterium sp. GJ3]|uniref:uroporphyrinogen-III synthase n=1 Tax=Photobacterium sp. GJ3 TaxID=2829502 RepID=UPI001B8B94A7|nr:uroporphyrinogen-III synthase [Photobacterium sp. GJ3]QUJ67422.1 uroporphyrinogen-III synthase [Photobacterium sp. GJ3]
MTVLITRPAPKGDALASALAERGIASLVQPLLTIAPGSGLPRLGDQLAALQEGDCVIAVSTHAVKMAHTYLTEQHISWPEGVHYLAVGQQTAEVFAQACGQMVAAPQREDSEGLLALPELAQPAQHKVLILRGNGGRELIFETLVERQASVSYCETYARHWLALKGDTLYPEWQQQGVDTLVVTSGQQLAYLVRLLPVQARDWLYGCRLLVPSERIETEARDIGFRHVTMVGSASNAALLTALSTTGITG